MREVANGLVCMYRTNTSKAEHFHSWLRTAANDVIGYLNGQSVNHFVAASFFPFDQKMCFPRQSEWKLRNLCLPRGKSPWKVSNKNKRTHQYVSSMPSKLVSCWMSNMANHFFFCNLYCWFTDSLRWWIVTMDHTSVHTNHHHTTNRCESDFFLGLITVAMPAMAFGCVSYYKYRGFDIVRQHK